jgi:hypothetical protein
MKRLAVFSLVVFAAVNLAFVVPVRHVCGVEVDLKNSPTSYIDWSDHGRLSWNDFKGNAKNWGYVSALTASAIEYKYDCDGEDIAVNAKAIFIPSESWVKKESKNQYILAHEQLHFDITEVYARKLRMRLTKEVKDCDDVYKISKIADKVMEEWKQEQKKYDMETKHSINKEMQAFWLDKVAGDLKVYAAYAL